MKNNKIYLAIFFVFLFSLFSVKCLALEENGLSCENGKCYFYKDGVRQSGFQEIDGKKYFFSRINNNEMRKGIIWIDGDYYYFKDDGSMYTGWYENNGNKYYFGNDGKRVSGFQDIDGKKYFFSRINNNEMRTGIFWIDGDYYYFKDDGSMYTGWYENNGNKYYFGNDGKRVSGFQDIDGKKYFFSRINNNEMRTGIFWIDGDYYYFKDDGSMYTGWYENNGNKYYFGNDGKRVSSIYEIDGVKYYFDNDGIQRSGFQKVGFKTYFFTRIDDHRMRYGFFEIDGAYYYFDEKNGNMLTGFQNVSGKVRFFGRIDGKMKIGWCYIDGHRYYFDNDGAMYTGNHVIDGVNYVFDDDGKVHDGFVSDIYGNTKYFYPDGTMATGWVTIMGIKYYFNSNGVLIGKNVKFVLDVSAHQGDIDWDTLWNSGQIDGVILRLGYGSDYTDQDDVKFLRNLKACERLGIPYGVYLYSYALNVNDAVSEANHALRLLKSVGSNFKYGVWFDMEDADGYKRKNGLNPNDVNNYGILSDITGTFVDIMSNNGYHSGVYASLSWFENQLNNSRINGYDKWVAQWNNSCSYNGVYSIWQYSSDVSVPGISGRVDGNVYFR